MISQSAKWVSPPDPRRILLIGATGFTGQRVLSALVARGKSPTLVGRDKARLSDLYPELGLPVEEADVADPKSLAGIVTSTDVVVSTVGPFTKLGRTAIDAAARGGAHYLDSTGEPPFIQDAFTRLADTARDSGATVVPAFGYDFVPGNLAGALALNQAGPTASSIEVGYFLTPHDARNLGVRRRASVRDVYAMTTGATRASLIGVIAEPSFAYRGRLVTERSARRVVTCSLDGVRRKGVTIGGSEHFGLPESFPQLSTVDVGLGWFDRASPVIRVGAALFEPFTRCGPVRRALPNLAGRLPGAHGVPTKEARALVIATARDQHGIVLRTVALEGPDPYAMTGELLAWGASRAADGHIGDAGVHGPVAAFGLSVLEQGCREAGLVPIHDIGGHK